MKNLKDPVRNGTRIVVQCLSGLRYLVQVPLAKTIKSLCTALKRLQEVSTDLRKRFRAQGRDKCFTVQDANCQRLSRETKFRLKRRVHRTTVCTD